MIVLWGKEGNEKHVTLVLEGRIDNWRKSITIVWFEEGKKKKQGSRRIAGDKGVGQGGNGLRLMARGGRWAWYDERGVFLPSFNA